MDIINKKDKDQKALTFIQDIFQMIDLIEKLQQKGFSDYINKFLEIELIEQRCLQDTLKSYQNISQIDSILYHGLFQNIGDSDFYSNIQLTLVKIKENLGLQQWILENIDFLQETMLKTYFCQIIVHQQYQSILIHQQNQVEILQIQNDYNNCDIVFIIPQQYFKIEFEEIINFIQLQRIFRNNYFISLKQFPPFLFDALIECDIYSLRSFFSIKQELEYIQDSQFYKKLTQIQFDFDQYTYISESNCLNTSLNLKEISNNIQNVFQSENIIYDEFLANQDTLIQIFCGHQESNTEQNVYFYFFENNQIVMKKEREDIHKDIIQLICSELENLNIQLNQKISHTQFSVKRQLKKKRKSNSNSDQFFILNIQQINNSDNQKQFDSNIWTQSAIELASYLNNSDLLKKFIVDFEQSSNQNRINNIIESEIPAVVNLIQEISQILQEPIQQNETEILQSSLSKIFVLNLI